MFPYKIIVYVYIFEELSIGMNCSLVNGKYVVAQNHVMGMSNDQMSCLSHNNSWAIEARVLYSTDDLAIVVCFYERQTIKEIQMKM